MKGWKTWVGAVVIFIGAGLRALATYYPDLAPIADGVMAFGGAFGLIGIGHKIEKSGTS